MALSEHTPRRAEPVAAIDVKGWTEAHGTDAVLWLAVTQMNDETHGCRRVRNLEMAPEPPCWFLALFWSDHVVMTCTVTAAILTP